MNDSTIFGVSPQKWEIINGFANWLSAIGTLAAVLVTLWLVRRQDRPRLKVFASVSSVWFAKNSPKNRKYLIITAVNIADRPASIRYLSLKFGLLRKEGVEAPPDPEISSSLPTEITYGQEAKWYIPLETNDRKWLNEVADYLMSQRPRVRVGVVSVYAQTTVGYKIKAKTGGSVARAFKNACKVIKQNG